MAYFTGRGADIIGEGETLLRCELWAANWPADNSEIAADIEVKMTTLKTTMKNMLRQRYSGTFFDSKALKVAGPVVDRLDRAAQDRNGIPSHPSLPPFTLRARSNGSWQQFGAERFVDAGDRLIDFLRDRGVLVDGTRMIEVGCGVGRYALALQRTDLSYTYLGLDIDAPSIAWCKKSITDERYSFDLVDISNDAYNDSGSIDAAGFTFPKVEDGSADLIFLWSVFTHMEFSDMSNYLQQFNRLLSADGKVLFSCFVYDEDRPRIVSEHPHAHNDGFIANPERPMKSIAFPLERIHAAIESAGLAVDEGPIYRVEPGAKMWPEGTGLGQDVFLLRRA